MNTLHSLSTWYRGRQARRAVWRQTTHRLFGLFALDPAGNIIMRTRFNKLRRGGWRAVVTDGGVAEESSVARRGRIGVPAVVPMHHMAASRRDELLRTARREAQAALDAEADGEDEGERRAPKAVLSLLESDGGVPVTDRRLRLSRSGTRWYLLTYRCLWALAAFCVACQYFRMKQALPLMTRCRLADLEDAVGETLRESATSTQAAKESPSVVAAAARAAWAGAVEAAKGVGGYDPSQSNRDRAAAAALEAALEAQRQEAARQRQAAQRNWTMAAWTVGVAACVVLFAV